MSSPDAVMRLVEEFAAARARGERPDVREYLARAGDGAGEFGALVAAIVAATPPPPPSPEARAIATALVPAEPPLLALRHRRGLTVDEVTDRLAAELEVPGVFRPRLRALYQRLEAGLIDASAIAGRLRTALADALDVGADRIVPAPAPLHDGVFARGPEGWDAALDDLPVDEIPGPESAEVDALFGLPA
jgi:hypothetical protein